MVPPGGKFVNCHGTLHFIVLFNVIEPDTFIPHLVGPVMGICPVCARLRVQSLAQSYQRPTVNCDHESYIVPE